MNDRGPRSGTAKLRLEDGRLLLEAGAGRDLLAWEHRLFFTTAAGFSIDEGNRRYVLSSRAAMVDVLRDTLEYLEDVGIDCELDDPVALAVKRMLAEDASYEEAARNGPAARQTAGPIELPTGFVRHLKPHQTSSVRHLLAVKHGANFSVPGSGKTSVVYAAFDTLRSEAVVDKLLVVGPRSCFQPWEAEHQACFGRPAAAVRLTGDKVSRFASYMDADRHTLFLCTYQTAANDLAELVELCERHRVFLVIDESHNIKRLEGGVWSEAVLRIAPYAARRAILSGTPMPNSYTDLWTQFTFLWPGKQVLGDRLPYKLGSEDENVRAQIRKTIRPFFVRVRKSDLGLPPIRMHKVECELKRYQSSIYRALSVRFLREIKTPPEDRGVLREWRKARMVRLIQAASNPALLAKYSEEFSVPPLGGEGASILQLIEKYPQYEVPAKVERATELIGELLAQGENVLLWTSFVHNIRMLQRILREIDPFVVYGAVPRDGSEDVEFNREQQIRAFKDSGRPSVLLANPAACAESVSLHRACHHAVYLDRTFNCGQFMQSMDRIHRIGLRPDEIVEYHVLVASHTIDETIDRRLEEKKASMISVLEDELPVGSLEVEEGQMGRSAREESMDFEETMRDIERQLSGQAGYD